MVVFGNRKYACLSCIRGHRSSSCEHRDRILLQIRKPGRKPQAEPQGRFALVWKEGSTDPLKYNGKTPNGRPYSKSPVASQSDYKLIRVPDIQNESAEVEPSLPSSSANSEEDSDEVVLTSKYIFVHVGDNLFRRELRPEFASADNQKQVEFKGVGSSNNPYIDSRINHCNQQIKTEPHTISRETSYLPPYEKELDPDHDTKVCNMNVQPTQMHSGSYQKCHDHIAGTSNSSKHDVKSPNTFIGDQNNGFFRSSLPEQTPNESDPRGSHMGADEYLLTGGEKVAPLVIGPMQYQYDYMNRQENIFNELGMTAEEATDLWPDNPSNFSFASQCVLPGQCQCGDGCACPDCYEHKLSHHQVKHDV